MNINAAFPSKYLKAAEFDEDATYTISGVEMESLGQGKDAETKPVVYFERADFILNALDAIVNHLDKAATLSRGVFKPAVILRITVGNSDKPLFTGPPHVQDFNNALREMVNFRVEPLYNADDVAFNYPKAAEDQAIGRSTALFEYKDLI